MERDTGTHPYSPDEARVASFFYERGIGGGDDPIGSMMAGYAYLVSERNEARAVSDSLLSFAEYVAGLDPSNRAPLFEKARAVIALAKAASTNEEAA